MTRTDSHLQGIRKHEFSTALLRLPAPPQIILEIGAGTGWQAKLISDAGYSVTAIDVRESGEFFPVVVYEGLRLPFGDALFDVVWTSHVLDHVREMNPFAQEIRRVLKPAGLWVVILPTSRWAFWNLLFLYFKMPLWLWRRWQMKSVPHSKPGHAIGSRRPRFLPQRLGERGNAVSEIFLFSRQRRLEFFAQNNWQVASDQPVGLFYTGARLLGQHLPFTLRRLLSVVLGSSGHIYFLQNNLSPARGTDDLSKPHP